MTILYFILAAIGLGILVFIHELGHYFAAKLTGMTVEVFSIGFGKPILKWRWHQVDWQLGWLPFGGYVKIAGMEFGKKDKYTYNDPYSIPNGFFTKAPWKRIIVACAGPFANFLLAFLIFTLLWVSGGREKPFSEFTHIIGWVDPQSELYELGVRPGDELASYNGRPYTNSKDLLYAAMLSGKKIILSGYHVDYASQTKKPFTYTIHGYQMPNFPKGILTTGIATTARYLIYDRFPNGAENGLPPGSPMLNSGIEYGDRLAWADGDYLFSMDQLSHIINQGKAFLTVKRDNEIILTKQPRVLASDLLLPAHVKNEIIDWQYETGLHKQSQDLYMLPYVLSSEGYVESQLEFIDERDQKTAFTADTKLELPLKPGDRIIAVDGVTVNKGYEILEKLQQHHVVIIVEKNQPIASKISWKNGDKVFEEPRHFQPIAALTKGIGLPQSNRRADHFLILNPIEPKSIDQFNSSTEVQAETQNELNKQKESLEGIRDKAKRVASLEMFEKSQKKLLLGIYLQDRNVNYNPQPAALLSNVLIETWQTLKALVMGYLSPKWISGPVGIVQVLHHGWKLGVSEALFWLGAISVNLAFFNLLPIPVLDGGYICLSLWEWITGRRLKAKTMERLIIPFVVLLIGLLIFLTFQDILRLF